MRPSLDDQNAVSFAQRLSQAADDPPDRQELRDD
jgi:hypothetical protein